MANDLGAKWREEFLNRGYIHPAESGGYDVGSQGDARHVTVTFDKQEHKLTELNAANEEFVDFKHGHIVSTYHWSQILGVHVFRA